MPPCDVAIVAIKSTENHQLPDLLTPVLKENGVVLVLQNGLGVDEEAARVVGPERVLGGLCFLCSNKVGPGYVRHLDYGLIALGEYRADGTAAGISDRLVAIADDFQHAGIPIDKIDHLLLGRWKKLVWNIPYNGLSVVLDAQTDALMADADTRALAEALMREVARSAGAFGCHIADAFVAKMLHDTARMVPYRPSMKVDFDAGRPMEVEAIFGNPVRAARTKGIDMPRTEMLYQQLAFLDRRDQVTRK